MDKSRVFVTGYKGRIGSHLIMEGYSPLACDVTDIVDIEKAIEKAKPKIIINCAAKTNVDWSERSDKTRDRVLRVNFEGALNLYEISEKFGIPVIQFTSDHIFSGRYLGNYDEYSADLYPVNWYGYSKMAAEAAANAFDNVKSIRTSCVIDSDRQSVKEHLDRIKNGFLTNPPVFMWRSFIHIHHFVKQINYYIDHYQNMPKILHVSGSKVISWYRFIYEYAGKMGSNYVNLVKPRFFEYSINGQAKRPYRTGLNVEKSTELGFPQYDFKDCVKEDFK